MPLVNADGNVEYVQATPDLVTPPGVRRKPMGTLFEDLRRLNAIIDKWNTAPPEAAPVTEAEIIAAARDLPHLKLGDTFKVPIKQIFELWPLQFEPEPGYVSQEYWAVTLTPELWAKVHPPESVGDRVLAALDEVLLEDEGMAFALSKEAAFEEDQRGAARWKNPKRLPE